MTREEAQREIDRASSELTELFRQVREKEAEADKYSRIVYPEDYLDFE